MKKKLDFEHVVLRDFKNKYGKDNYTAVKSEVDNIVHQMCLSSNMSLLIGEAIEGQKPLPTYVINSVPQARTFVMFMQPVTHTVRMVMTPEDFVILLHDTVINNHFFYRLNANVLQQEET